MSSELIPQADAHPAYVLVEPHSKIQEKTYTAYLCKTETARHFRVSDDTIRTWLRRADDDSFVDTHTPVNRFPDFVRYAVQQIKLLCPTLGKVKIADTLALAGIRNSIRRHPCCELSLRESGNFRERQLSSLHEPSRNVITQRRLEGTCNNESFVR